MICLSKADKGSLRHLTFNQSPGPLAAEHTTRQDMNGISNLREHVAADQDDDSGGGGLLSSADADEKWHRQGLSPGLGHQADGAGRWFCGPSSRRQAAGGDDQTCPSVISQASLARLWGWITWTASVILVSYLLTSLSAWRGQATLSQSDEATPETVQPPISDEAPVSIVQGLRKRDSCASGGVASEEYNTPLHVGALLIIWFVSALSCSFPLLAKKFPGLHIPKRFFFFVRHFGTGVLIATAFVHLLPTAFISLGDPCLGGFWVNDYPAMPGAIALASIFFVTVLEMVFHPARKCTSIQVAPAQSNVEAIESDETPADGERTDVVMRDIQPPRARSSSVGHVLNQLPTVDEGGERGRAPEKGELPRPSIDSANALSPEQKLRKERLQCMLLELGILFHSIFIGMALSVSVGNEFIILLIAIIFHQTFEGLALGSRISMVRWPEQNKYQPWLMAMAYGLTTPLGQAIGIATHTLYSPDSEVGLIVVGVMNSISAGLLTFASLVELMSEDFLSDESWQYLRGRRRVIACLFVFLGAFAMSLVGAWA